MPEIIIEQNQNISNYINMLQLPYSSSIQKHMLNMVSGIITAEGNKNVSAIYRKLTCNRDRSCGSRFLAEYKWKHELAMQLVDEFTPAKKLRTYL